MGLITKYPVKTDCKHLTIVALFYLDQANGNMSCAMSQYRAAVLVDEISYACWQRAKAIWDCHL